MLAVPHSQIPRKPRNLLRKKASCGERCSSHPSRLARIARVQNNTFVRCLLPLVKASPFDLNASAHNLQQLGIGFNRSFSDGFSDSVSPSVLPGDSRPSQKGPLEWHVDSGLYALLETDPRSSFSCCSWHKLHLPFVHGRTLRGLAFMTPFILDHLPEEESVRVGLLQSVALSLHHLLCFSLTPFDFLNAHLVSIGSSFRFLFGFFIRLVLPLVSLHCPCPPLRQTISATLLVFFASILDSASGFFHTLPSDILSSLFGVLSEVLTIIAPPPASKEQSLSRLTIPTERVAESFPIVVQPLSDGTCEAERVRRFLPVVAIAANAFNSAETTGTRDETHSHDVFKLRSPVAVPLIDGLVNSPSSSFVISKSGHATPIDVWNDLQVIIQWKNESITATLEDNTLPVKGRDRKESESFLSVTPRRCASLGCLGHAERVALFNKSGDVEPSDDADLLPLGGGLILSGGGECVAVRFPLTLVSSIRLFSNHTLHTPDDATTTTPPPSLPTLQPYSLPQTTPPPFARRGCDRRPERGEKCNDHKTTPPFSSQRGQPAYPVGYPLLSLPRFPFHPSHDLHSKSSLLARATDYNRMKERSIVAGEGTPHPTALPQLSTLTLSIVCSSVVLVPDMVTIEGRAEESRRTEEENRDFLREMQTLLSQTTKEGVAIDVPLCIDHVVHVNEL
ncbi:hypothetical protein BLNAU_5828 [Blattamonas nauphoetae]|uniref:Uncharacterized protein n=1 Tax=Blattamonas nauphoetae TaxID=2049346 RepID=A0ABQ9Y6F2_9EUKA|nr:hypothetical protein BLNAU_5828 [Blattamonas nauphoetae]